MTESVITPQTPYELNPEFPNLAGFNRMERAMAILAHPHSIKKVAPKTYTIKSQAGFVSYVVKEENDRFTCTCPDHLLNHTECKHILALKEYLKQKELDLHARRAENPRAIDWSNYTLAQKNEGELFPIYLKQLVDLIDEPETAPRRGRKSVPLADNVFCAVSKVASQLSSRRAYKTVVDAEKANLIERQYNYNGVNIFLNREDITPLLRELLRMSAAPLAQIEDKFAIDASGFGTYQYGDWCANKHGTKREHTFVKAHVACGVMSNIITDAVVTDSSVGDMNVLPTLVEGTAGRFDTREISADAGYASNKNYEAIQKAGAVGYIAFKGNTTGKGCPAWRDAFTRFVMNRAEFEKHYNLRNNVETVFSSIKAKYQEKLKSKNTVAQINELYCKLIAYNISVVIRMAHTDDIEVMFR